MDNDAKISNFLKLRQGNSSQPHEISFLALSTPTQISGPRFKTLSVSSPTEEIKSFFSLKGVIVLKAFVHQNTESETLKKLLMQDFESTFSQRIAIYQDE